MKAKTATVSILLLTVLLTVWGVFVAADWVSEYLATKQSPAYEELPFEFKLKAKPEDVIYSEAYTTSDGQDIVKYAYLADEVGPQLNEDISRRTPNSYTEVIEKFEDEEGKPMEKLKTTFVSKPAFYEKEGKWKSIEYATTTPEIFSMSGAIPYIKRRELVERFLPGAPVFADTSTFNPDPDAETSSVDGYIEASGYFTDFTVDSACTEAFTIAVDNTIGDSSFDSSTSLSIYVFNHASLVDPDFECIAYIRRSFVLFNTATLPDSILISSATFSLYVINKTNGDNDGQDTINIVSSNPASNTALATTDFGNVGSTLYASAADISSVSTSAYTNFTLNGTGQAAISTTGATKFGVREGHDLAYSRPANSSQNTVNFSSADTSGTSQDPKLEITYTVLSTFSMGQWFPF